MLTKTREVPTVLYRSHGDQSESSILVTYGPELRTGKNKYMLFTGREVRTGKIFKTALGRRPRDVFDAETKYFPVPTDVNSK